MEWSGRRGRSLFIEGWQLCLHIAHWEFYNMPPTKGNPPKQSQENRLVTPWFDIYVFSKNVCFWWLWIEKFETHSIHLKKFIDHAFRDNKPTRIQDTLIGINALDKLTNCINPTRIQFLTMFFESVYVSNVENNLTIYYQNKCLNLNFIKNSVSKYKACHPSVLNLANFVSWFSFFWILWTTHKS